MENLKGNPMFQDIMSKKICIVCRIEKTIDSFYKATIPSKDGYQNRCKKCGAEYQKNFQKLRKKYNTKPKSKPKEKIYKHDVKPSNKQYNRAVALKNVFGITLEAFNAMFEEQKGCCYICGVHQSLLKKNLCVDHCHITGKVRKLLCFKCNVGIGMLNDSSEMLGKAKDYLILFGN